jgi:plastocyanin
MPGDNGTLQNVVVYLQGDFSHYAFPPVTTPAHLDQKGCMFEPHVVALMTGQVLHITNSDQMTHNVNGASKNNQRHNESQAAGGTGVDETFPHEEVAIPIKCNIHPWMKAYVAVLASPYFQVTGKDGSFELTNVPPGTYKLTAWHERYGATQQEITVVPKQEKNVTLTFNAAAS